MCMFFYLYIYIYQNGFFFIYQFFFFFIYQIKMEKKIQNYVALAISWVEEATTLPTSNI